MKEEHEKIKEHKKTKEYKPDIFDILWIKVKIPLISIILALFIGGLIIAISGSNPLLAYKALFQSALGSVDGFGRTLEKATPLIFSGLAVTFAFKAGLFNIGTQGQLLMGAITSAFLGFAITGLPAIIHIPLALLGGALAGALFGSIPGLLKTFTGASEVITTIMLNYIAINITDYLSNGPLKEVSSTNVVARTPQIQASAEIPRFAGLPLGFFIAVLFAIFIWWLLEKTTLGFEIKTAGISGTSAKYAGIKVSVIIVIAMVISGALAGIGGAVETQGIVGRYQPGFNTGLGFDGITVSLLGKANPIGNIFSALLIGAMKAGGAKMQFVAGVTPEITNVVQALMLFFVAADRVVRWIIRQKDSDDDGLKITAGWGN